MTAMLELPGVKKSDLKINLSVCPYSRVRQVTISGRINPMMSSVSGYAVRERKFGEYRRVVVVPPDTKPGDIEIVMEDGILILRIPCGTPIPYEPPQELAL
ncbi:hypothetical protein EUX98_g1819 [Antrodiella citrinella]|uniref:SHSP domain-containing protein n=1 Tax=Antrodiella citrinella TaxID=2447956 RepID=A0A4S4N3H4_9APHY|nr:hypothetical protein EUX98_g1819 [Antrodiella citrinella]